VHPAGDDPWAGYARLVVEITRGEGDLVVRADRSGRTGPWPWVSPATVYVLTAWDPAGARPGAAVNRTRQAALESELATLVDTRWPARGTDPLTGRADEGVALRGLATEQVRLLGARYGQDAVFEWTPDEWAIVGCREDRRLGFGWSLVRPGSTC
jgi:hypothetical protein